MTTLVLCSGGLDSVTLAHHLAAADESVKLLAIDYGQTHRRELYAAQQCAERLDTVCITLRITPPASIFTGSSLVDGAGSWSGAGTVVPHRNAVFLSLATAAALSRRCREVAFAAHAGDAALYLDCRPRFLDAYRAVMQASTEGAVTLATPFIRWSKADIVTRAVALGIPLAQTWSCYRGRGEPCGDCGACTERAAAFAATGERDPLVVGA